MRDVLLSDDQGAESKLSMNFIPKLINLIERMLVELRGPVELVTPTDLVVTMNLVDCLVKFLIGLLITLFFLETLR